MGKVNVYIDMTGEATSWLYFTDAWKEFVSGEFDQNVVLYGNHRYTEVKEAEWWDKAEKLLADLGDCDGEIDYAWYEGQYSAEQLDKVLELYHDDNYKGSYEDFEKEVAMILTPGLELLETTIRGSVQGEWQNVIYVKGSIDCNALEDWYFGNVCGVFAVDEDEVDLGSSIITNSALYDMEKDDDFESEVKTLLGLDETDEIVKVFKCTGYKQVQDWKEV